MRERDKQTSSSWDHKKERVSLSRCDVVRHAIAVLLSRETLGSVSKLCHLSLISSSRYGCENLMHWCTTTMSAVCSMAVTSL